MYYEVLVNGIVLAAVGHPNIKSMNLSVGVYDDGNRPAVFANAVCSEDGELWLYDWFHGGHLVSVSDTVTFRQSEQATSIEPLHKYKMRKEDSGC